MELKPCPFCGRKPRMTRDIDGDCRVRCQNCGATTYYARTEEEATKAWNRRADDGN